MFEEIRPHHPPRRPGERPQRNQDGSEARTAKALSPKIKALFAAVGVILCLPLGILAWNVPLPWLAIPLFVLAAWALADLLWQLSRLRRHDGPGEPRGE